MKRLVALMSRSAPFRPWPDSNVGMLIIVAGTQWKGWNRDGLQRRWHEAPLSIMGRAAPNATQTLSPQTPDGVELCALKSRMSALLGRFLLLRRLGPCMRKASTAYHSLAYACTT